MSTAEDLRAEFTAYMRENDVKYTIQDEADNIVKLAFGATKSKDNGGARTEILVDFDEEGDKADSVHFVAWEFASCTNANFAEVLYKVNGYNRRYRWVKFWVKPTDDGGVLCADGDATVIPGMSAEEITHFAFRMSDIVEDVIVDLGNLVITGDSYSKEDILALLQLLSERS